MPPVKPLSLPVPAASLQFVSSADDAALLGDIGALSGHGIQEGSSGSSSVGPSSDGSDGSAVRMDERRSEGDSEGDQTLVMCPGGSAATYTDDHTTPSDAASFMMFDNNDSEISLFDLMSPMS